MNENAKCLTESELHQIELSELKARLEFQQIEMLKLRQEVIQLKAKNYGLIAQLKQQEISEATQRANALKTRHTQFMNQIKVKYEIDTPAWGYDPISGEIKQ